MSVMEKKQREIEEERAANERALKEANALKDIEQQKKVMVKNMLQGDIQERKNFLEVRAELLFLSSKTG